LHVHVIPSAWLASFAQVAFGSQLSVCSVQTLSHAAGLFGSDW
jgi:hypothetical protein